MAVALKPILPPTRSGRTFLAAATLLGAGAALQLLILAWWFAHGAASSRRTQQSADFPLSTPAVALAPIPAPAIAAPTPVTATRIPAPVPQPLPVAPLAGENGIPQEPSQPPPEFTRPTPAPVQRYQGNPQNLLEYARALRQRGDTNTALARLRDGLATEPNNPDLIAETALTYEAMQLSDKAFEQWQRVFDMGESIGALYYMADTKLHSAPGHPGATALAPTGGTGRDDNGFQDNAVLKITDVHSEDVLDDPAAEKKTLMRIVVKARPGVVIDPGKVKIETYFYDLLDGKDTVLTDAQTSYKWLSEPVDWANDASEVLQTTYTRLRSEPAPESPVAALAAPTPTPSANPIPGGKQRRGRRSAKAEAELAQALAESAPPPEPDPVHVRIYLGYSVRVYYDRQLQDVQADPIRLLQKFPPPLTLPLDEENPLLPAPNSIRRPN